MDFWRAAAVLGKRKWLILFSVVATVILTYAATRLVGTQWQATVQLASSNAAPLLPGGAGGRDPGQQQAKLQSAYYTGILKSGEILTTVFQKQLHIQPSADLINNIQIEANGINLYQLEVSYRNPSVAELIANTLAKQFVTVIAEKERNNTTTGINTLKQQLKKTNDALSDAQNKLNTYRVEHKINLDLKNSEGLALNQLAQAERNRDAAEEKMYSAQARLAQARTELAATKTQVSVPAPASSDPVVKGLQDQLTDLNKRLALAQASYTNSDPRVLGLLNQIAQTQHSIQQHEQTSPDYTQQTNPEYTKKKQQVQQLQGEVASDQAVFATAQRQVQDAQNLVNSYKGVDTPLNQLQGDVNALEATRARLENTLNNATPSPKDGPLKILAPVNEFNPPINTSLGRTIKLIILGALCALIGSSALVIAFDSIDRRLRSVKEAEVILPTRVLAAIPQPMGDVSYASLARATELYPLSLHSEAYRFLGQHLLNAHRRMRSYMVLSAKAEQGSTSTVTNLGITLAQAGQRVIIVDANVRTPEIHQVFGLANDYGFMDLLQKPDAPAFEQALHATNVPNLQVITSGTAPENPWQSFRSQNLMDVAHRLRDMADYVLYDTPSALLFTDAMNLAPVVDAAFLCVRALEPPTGAERRLVELLEQANVPVLGSVLTDVPASVLEGYNNYQHYYAPAVQSVPLVANNGEGGVTIATAVTTHVEDVKNGHDGNNGNLIS
ncbi:MAG TPA: polysaccharide biosynthesis tyrosine autokinase [Chthonomonadaceae bacterium]|nr:polysaccharide biosynthesis tyrosine autokinase [Chthonomonadaceae bacterium]